MLRMPSHFHFGDFLELRTDSSQLRCALFFDTTSLKDLSDYQHLLIPAQSTKGHRTPDGRGQRYYGIDFRTGYSVQRIPG